MPPKHDPLRPPRAIPTKHLKEVLGRRKFQWEIVKQLFEEYWLDGSKQNDVCRPADDPVGANVMVLQFQQGPHFYRLVYEPLSNPLGPPRLPVEAFIITVLHDGTSPGFPRCSVQQLDGSYDLPEENIP